MKRKWIFGILAVVMVFSIFSISQGADKFYYGAYKVCASLPYESPKLGELKDSLRFNIVEAWNLNQDNIHFLANNSLQALAYEPHDTNSPSNWSVISHYTLWEAEGFPGSNWNLRYNGGTLVDDASASGGKAMAFAPPDLPHLIQWGPTYHQEREYRPGQLIEYKAEFRLQYTLYIPRGAMAPRPPGAPVCSIMVVDRGTILKAKTLYPSDLGVGYKKKILDYTVPEWNQIEFQIYWFGTGVLYVDYVKVYDNYRWQLIEQEGHPVAEQIKAYVNQSWVHTTLPDGDTVVYRWSMRDQPGYIDCYEPYAYIDSLLKSNLPRIPGIQATCYFGDTNWIHDYLIRSEPVQYMIDAYPLGEEDTTESNIQQSLNWLTDNYNYNKRKAESLDKDFWVVVQAHLYAEVKKDSCKSDQGEIEYDDTIYCTGLKDPGPNEIRVLSFLPLCYGADAVMYYAIPLGINYFEDPPILTTGLYDAIVDTPTAKWEEIKNFTGPRVEKLGPIIKDLTWLGACPDDSVGSFILRNGEPSYIYNIVPRNHHPAYVEVGFFRDSLSGDD